MKNLNLVYKINTANHTIKLIFSRTCLSKTIIIYDIMDFIKAISCLEPTHVPTKQRLAVIFASFQFFKKNAKKVNNFFFSIFCVFCWKYLPLVTEFQENKLIIYTNLHNETWYNNVNFISLGKIFDTQDTFRRQGVKQ